jgi:hypothetical protein
MFVCYAFALIACVLGNLNIDYFALNMLADKSRRLPVSWYFTLYHLLSRIILLQQ